MIGRATRIATLLLLIGAPIVAQQPNLGRGFAADKLYDFLGMDSVNQFNGNVILRIPLGQEYKGNGMLAYRFALSYNSSVWDYVWSPDGTQLSALPSRSSNAGMGWLLTFGTLLPPGSDPDAVHNPGNDSSLEFAYISSDGARHLFFDTHHDGDAVDPKYGYTRDGTYLRMTKVTSVIIDVEFPDGTKQEFTKYVPGPGPWPTLPSGTKWRLFKVEDAFGNRLDFNYSSSEVDAIPDYPEIWRITDGSREHTVYFKTALSNYSIALDHVDLEAFNGSTATYSMAYQNVTFTVTGAGDNEQSTRVAPVLTSVGMPDSTSYQMKTPADLPAYDTAAISGAPGGLTRMVLPTLGTLSWEYEPFDDRAGWSKPSASVQTPSPPAVTKRILAGPGPNTPGTWTYSRFAGNGAVTCDCGQQFPCNSGKRQLTAWVNQPDGSSKISYFSIYSPGDRCPAGGWNIRDYGLPFTRATTSGNGFLSAEVRSGPPSTDWSGLGGMPAPGTADPLWQSEYVRYERDFTTLQDNGARPNYFKTVYGTSTNCPTCFCPGCFRETTPSQFDLFGHYRQTVIHSDVTGSPAYRTTFVNQPGALDAQQHWVLNVPAETCVADEDLPRADNSITACSGLPGASTTALSYDRATGALLGRRVLGGANATATTHDLLSLFTYDTKGNLTKERFWGGDNQTLSNTSSGTLFTETIAPDYEVSHVLTYDANGTLTARKSTYRNIRGAANYASSVDFNASNEDVDLDVSTGAVKTTRDSAGVATSFTFDTLGRLKDVTAPTTLASTALAYTTAALSGTTYTPATASVTTDSTMAGSIKRLYEYDSLGRLLHDKTLMPDGTWSQVERLYNASGQVASVSTQQKESTFNAGQKTSFEYDATGKPKKITAPDGSFTEVKRFAAGQVDTTVKTNAGVTNLARTEKYDGLGRLRTVIENSGPTSATQTSGSQVATTYGYDRADRLTSVSNSAGQPRSFAYDLRGLMTSETHPESGTTMYSGYDARGHATGRVAGASGGAFDLTFEYDSAERLTQVNDLASGGVRRILKKYTFSDANDASRGKLLTAKRVNHPLGITGDVDVTESYFYLGPAGAASKKDTEVKVSGAVLQTFTQSYGYDDLGAAKTVDYPTCATATPCTVSGGVGTLSRTFTNGRLTGVGSYASAISYHPNGTINQVTHPGSVIVTDTQEQDPNGMARPKVIRFNGYTTTTCPTSVTITPEVTTMCVNVSKNASVTADGASYSWTIQNGTITSADNLQTITFTSATAGTVILQATVTVAGCTPVSAPQASVTVTASASITAGQPADPMPIAPQGTATLTVTASGSNLQYQWYQGVAPDTTGPVPGATGPSFTTPPLAATTTYWVQVSSNCGTAANSRTATVMVLAAPSSVQARTDTPTTKVVISWSQVSNASKYVVEWATNVNGTFSAIGPPTPFLSAEHNVSPSATPVAYVYRLRSLDAADRMSPAVSPMDYAVTATALFTDERIQKNVSGVKAAHIVELRRAIDALRAAANLPPVWQSASPPSGLISAAPTNELFAPFNAARQVFGLPNFAYGAGTATPASGVRILSEHIQEVRDALR